MLINESENTTLIVLLSNNKEKKPVFVFFLGEKHEAIRDSEVTF